jgi:predicted N-acetyltransferase YhbS
MTAETRRKVVVNAAGLAVADYVDVGRLGPPRAELVRSLTSDVQAAAAPLLAALPGFRISCADDALTAALVAVGAHEVRRFAFMRALVQSEPPPWPPAATISGVVLRQLSPDDIRELALLELRAFPPGHLDHHSNDFDEVAQSNYERITDPARVLMAESALAFKGQQPVGVVVVQFVDRIPDMQGPWLTNIARDPDSQYAGLGASMISSVMTALRKAGHQQAFLAVTDGNPARRVYERAGFVDVCLATSLKLPESE